MNGQMDTSRVIAAMDAGVADAERERRWILGIDDDDPEEKEVPGHEDGEQGHTNGKASKPPEDEKLSPLCAAALQGKDVPPLKFLAGEWIPAGKAVLLAGKGGGGKTTLAMQLAVARALGVPFLDLMVDPGSTLALLCEEDADDAHRLLDRLGRHYDVTLQKLQQLHYLPRAGEDNALIARTRSGELKVTPLYGLLRQAIGDLKPSLLILDNARHVARINENDGSEVTGAWSLLHGLMVPTGGTTLLAGHTPKNGTSEFSGNAAWENTARCRLFLGPVQQDDGEEPIENDPRRILRRGKSNANGTASMDITWFQGAFRRAEPLGGTYADQLERDMRKGQARQAFLDGLDRLGAQGRNVSHSGTARNYAPKVMMTAGLAMGFARAELDRAMNELLSEGIIRANEPLGWSKARNPLVGLARAAGA